MQQYRFSQCVDSGFRSDSDDVHPILLLLIGILLFFILYKLFIMFMIINNKKLRNRKYEGMESVTPTPDLVSHPKLIPSESESEEHVYDPIYAYNNVVSYNDEDSLYDSVFDPNTGTVNNFNKYTDYSDDDVNPQQYACTSSV